jgi:phage terminase small subunit
MTPKQETFVREYAIDMNATQAAVRAGYSEKTAYSIGQENLKKPEIAAAVTEAQSAHAERCNVTISSLTNELEAARRMAEENCQASAMVSATMSKAKLHGLLIDDAMKVTSLSYRNENGPMASLMKVSW